MKTQRVNGLLSLAWLVGEDLEGRPDAPGEVLKKVQKRVGGRRPQPLYFLESRNRVVARTAPRVATTDATDAQPQPFDGAVFLQSLNHVVAAGGLETAAVGQPRR